MGGTACREVLSNPHPSPARGRGAGGEGLLAALLLTLLASVPAHAADPPLDHHWVLDLTGEYLSATFPGDRTAEASAVTLGLGVAPGDRWAFRVEVPVVRVRSSQPLRTRLEPTRRVLSAVASGNRNLQRQVPGEWQTGLGDVRLEIQGDLAGGGAKLHHLVAKLDVKAPTADEEERLGTGQWDARIGLLGERRFWSATLFGGAGFSRLGDLPGLELRDGPDAFLGVESEPWRNLRAAAWIEGQSAVLAGAEARSALGAGVRSSGRHPWRLVATVGLTGAEEEIGVLFGVSALGSGGTSWGRPAGRRGE